jgi:hypothetical protein
VIGWALHFTPQNKSQMENEKVNEIEEKIRKAWAEIVIMEERLGALPAQVDTFSQKINDLESNINGSKDQIANINTHFTDYYTKPDAATKSKLEFVTEHHTEVTQFLKASSDLKNEFEEFREFIYGNEKLKKLGFKKEIELLYRESQESAVGLNAAWVETYQTLYNKIEGLLPGATATGLSKAYQDQKESYWIPVLAWSFVFGLTVAGMMGYAIWKYDETKSFEDSLRHILARLPFFIPAIWLAIFASKQQSQYKRLQQEYSYKETLAKSYEAYKREIDKLPESVEKTELHQRLITSMVEMCGYNPSLTLEHKSHEDKPPIPGASILKGLTGAKTEK